MKNSAIRSDEKEAKGSLIVKAEGSAIVKAKESIHETKSNYQTEAARQKSISNV